eukprot:COSAG06_NODE_17090_length_963_cov_1.497680_1_plen_154_part_10
MSQPRACLTVFVNRCVDQGRKHNYTLAAVCQNEKTLSVRRTNRDRFTPAQRPFDSGYHAPQPCPPRDPRCTSASCVRRTLQRCCCHKNNIVCFASVNVPCLHNIHPEPVLAKASSNSQRKVCTRKRHAFFVSFLTGVLLVPSDCDFLPWQLHVR